MGLDRKIGSEMMIELGNGFNHFPKDFTALKLKLS
jgi:hypothetical protein